MPNRVVFRRAIFVFACAVILIAASVPVQQADPSRYLNDIKSLTTPEMEGRGAGTKGIVRAQHLIEKRYKELGLQPAGVNGYAQPFTVITGARLKSDNHFAVQTSETKKNLKIDEEFVPFSFSSSGEADGPVVFRIRRHRRRIPLRRLRGPRREGQNRSRPLRHEPKGFAEKSGNHGLTQHSQVITKAINARNHGAKAVVVVNGKLGDGEEDLLTRFGSVSGPENIGIVVVQVKNAIADSWFQSAGKSLKDVQDQINAHESASFDFPASLRLALHIDIETTRATVNNVLAWLPGQTDEYVIIGAHYDHLGRGNFDSLAPSQIGQIHPGADDNGSGTAGVLELARLLAPQRGQLKRSILFMNFSGEELGLLGSAAWVKNPTRPLDKAVAMINMDMIGRIKDDKVYIGGVGTGSTFKSVLEQAQKESPFKIEYSAGGYSSSDHTSFVTKRPALLLRLPDYHKPSDTWDKINAPSAARLLDMVGNVALQLANAQDAPAFQVVAEDKPASGGGGSGYGPYFGSIPDFGQTENGVKFSDVKTEFAGGESRIEGRRRLDRVRWQADQESLRLHRRPAAQQGGRCCRSEGTARRAAGYG